MNAGDKKQKREEENILETSEDKKREEYKSLYMEKLDRNTRMLVML